MQIFSPLIAVDRFDIALDVARFAVAERFAVDLLPLRAAFFVAIVTHFLPRPHRRGLFF